ncbi:MAG TPA: protein-L-isoaspartate(D-aspartate) O-methyltransferase [Phycisphaerae bacterium]|nr:protein-L-isoaspartate(D-aspartate) O-methyltransferase [Phycisphaerae bacterium]
MRPERFTRDALRAAGAAAILLLLAVAPGCSTAAENPSAAEAKATAAASPAPAKAEKRDAPATESGESKQKTWTPPKFTARQRERDRMVETIKNYGCTDKAVLAAMAAVPRHEFVPMKVSSLAYHDAPLPTAHGQTISQPYMVAEMTRLLRLKDGDKVLEIGTGSGYQAAVLTHFTTNVYTIEIIRPLAETAAKRLKRLGYDPVKVRCGDGHFGWPEHAPFDAIIGTAVAGKVPPALIEQLKVGGRMVIPIGPEHGVQRLMLVEKDAPGRVRQRTVMLVRFVPMLHEDPTERK